MFLGWGGGNLFNASARYSIEGEVAAAAASTLVKLIRKRGAASRAVELVLNIQVGGERRAVTLTL